MGHGVEIALILIALLRKAKIILYVKARSSLHTFSPPARELVKSNSITRVGYNWRHIFHPRVFHKENRSVEREVEKPNAVRRDLSMLLRNPYTNILNPNKWVCLKVAFARHFVWIGIKFMKGNIHPRNMFQLWESKPRSPTQTAGPKGKYRYANRSSKIRCVLTE